MIEITMPRLSDTMEEGAIATWHKKPGDRVEIGDILVEIETDKATMEYEAYEAGTLSKILVEEGENVTIGTPIALLDDGTDAAGPAPEPSIPEQTPVPEPSIPEQTPVPEPSVPELVEGPSTTANGDASGASTSSATGTDPAGASTSSATGTDPAGASTSSATGTDPAGASTGSATGAGERRIASPLVRKLAQENHLDLRGVDGTGPGGRIIRADIEHLLVASPASVAATPSVAEPVEAPLGATSSSTAGPSTSSGTESSGTESSGTEGSGGASVDERRASESVPLSTTRRVIARRLGESARSIPHFYVTARADAEQLVALRTELNAQLVAAGRPKVSINDLLIRASALALREHPLVNASYIDDESKTMLVHHRVNVGVAVASANGLVVPVIDDADTKTVTQLGAETKQLVALANDKKLTPAQMSGGTFTISNLGMYGVEEFTAIINPPEGAILAVGGTTREPVVVGDEIVTHHVMRYTLSADHRIVDGALAAQFLQTLTRLIETPWTIIA